MATKWITVITNEAMQKVCYTGGGWVLKPNRFHVSSTDVLNGMDLTNIDTDDTVLKTAQEILLNLNTATMTEDENKWCTLPFSSVSKLETGSTNYSVLSHHVYIPGNYKNSNQEIKTIYFEYAPKDDEGEGFLYAIAYAVETIAYEVGVTQSHNFTFSMANAENIENTQFVLNYTFPHELSDHNTDINAHDQLVSRNGERELEGLLKYSEDSMATENPFADTDTEDNRLALVTREYVDKAVSDAINALKAQLGIS